MRLRRVYANARGIRRPKFKPVAPLWPGKPVDFSHVTPSQPAKTPAAGEAAPRLISEVLERVDKNRTEELKKLVGENTEFTLLDFRTPDDTRVAQFDAPQDLNVIRG